ncbi:transglycosylase SLT domain-containing protein [Suttonella ornithocola]|uniref:Uncharacterized protein conserved in bacteria n=1 Tax=Suttonella ornithocola TaxID=279832 RepID=A0A380MXU3_9GAMM|nr:transglycosylase SLT domain-containing protein [Suttonella ornithocola]SUO97024.1 Uncharacterized protein conserved in bacteria [Suttonella ornithocola]
MKTGFLLGVSLCVLTACSGSGSLPNQAPQVSTRHWLPTHDDARFNGEIQPPESLQEDACALLDNRPHWRLALGQTRAKWGVEPWYVLAFLHQESRFNPTAMSTSRAYGYAQVKDESWDWYILKTGNKGGSRERFDDAVDFMGFYATQNEKRNGVALNDVKNQYLAYHEGMGGFERGSFLGKPWLLTISDKVLDRAAMYQAQLLDCPIVAQ